jgi:hypothetical protein
MKTPLTISEKSPNCTQEKLKALQLCTSHSSYKKILTKPYRRSLEKACFHVLSAEGGMGEESMFPCAFRVSGVVGLGDGGNRSCHVLSMKGGNGENGSCHVLSMKWGNGENGSCQVLSMKGENGSCHVLSLKAGNGENGSCHVLSMKGGKGESGSCDVL